MAAASSFVLLALLFAIAASAAKEGPLYGSANYDTGAYGYFPTVRYNSSEDFDSPRINIARWDPSCDSDELYFLSLHGKGEDVRPSLMILDQYGQLVWQHRTRLGPNHLQVVRYKGEDYLAYWMGNETRGVGMGSYFMLNSSYHVAYEIKPAHNLTGDLHAFSITEQNTALFTVYTKTKWDYTAYEKKQHWIWENSFQEMDIETGELIFEWNATDHLKFGDMGTDTVKRDDGPKTKPWDWLHINSVVKDSRGNYLMGSRYYNAATYIDGRTGRILWNIGGPNNSFTDLSGGAATDFACQHDVRWTDNYTAITLFDNNGFWGRHDRIARGMKIGVNERDMTIQLLAEYTHPNGILSESQGSHSVLENGHHLIGWGHTAAFSEYSPSGELLCDIHFAPIMTADGLFNRTGKAQSYRVYKQRWRGFPTKMPNVAVANGTFWVSWNGATEVRYWNLEGARKNPEGVQKWEPIATFNKTGFESETPVNVTAWAYYNLAAFDTNGTELGSWVFDVAAIRKSRWSALRAQISKTEVPNPLLVVSCIVVIAAISIRLYRRTSFISLKYTFPTRYSYYKSIHAALPR